MAASVLDEGWLHTVRELPGPYLFVTEGVLVYLAEDDVRRALTRLAVQFPGELVALDTYSHRMFDRQQQMAAKRDIARVIAGACEAVYMDVALRWLVVGDTRAKAVRPDPQ